jgi:hypothetical protein
MPFKKNSPGCVCCIGHSEIDDLDTINYTNISRTGVETPANASNAFPGDSANVFGVDIENKYILVYLSGSDEIWTLNPSTNLAVAKLWDTGRDATDINATGTIIHYIASWNVAYGLWRDSASTYSIVVFDSNGDYLHGPYTQFDATTSLFQRDWTLGDFTIKSNGDLYYFQTNGNNVEIRINNEITYPRAGAASITLDEPWRTAEGIIRYTPIAIFSNGTNIYMQINGGSALARGVYEIDGVGNMTLVINSDEILPQNGYLNGLAYNNGQSRWEGEIIFDQDTNRINMGWIGLGEDESLLFRDFSALSASRNRAELITAPLDIESYWDAL